MELNKKYKTILVDDEPHARFRLKEILKQTGKFEIVAEAKDGFDGQKLINRLKPDVVFLDIEMPNMNGFEMLENITYDPYVIFCTAYDKYAIKAFETLSVDYLLKPVELARLIKTIEKLFRLSEQTELIRQVKSEIQANKSPQNSNIIPVKIGDRIILLNLEKVTHFEASEKSVYLFEVNGKKYLSDHSLQSLETKLPNNFIRVSRSVIVNKHTIIECRKYFKGKYILVLNDKNKSKVVSGSSYSDRMKELFVF